MESISQIAKRLDKLHAELDKHGGRPHEVVRIQVQIRRKAKGTILR
jgi:hypothetical protein